jgi:S-DNA-T family DNA segregation ATPase FtsK/SpoIIIE
MSIKGYSGSRAGRKYRIAAVCGTLLLSAVALVLTFSIAGALFDLPFIARGLGNFFVRSYGVLAFLIPAYLVWAAVILAAPSYHPDRIFVLAAAIIPFMTLAIGIGFIQDFNFQAERIPALQKAGKTGFSFFIVLLAFVEGMIIRAFVPLLFPELAAAKTRKPGPAPSPTPKSPIQRQETPVTRYLPKPRPPESAATNTAPETPSSSSLSSPSTPPEKGAAAPGTKPGDTGVSPIIIRFPDPKPLSSARALEELEQNTPAPHSPLSSPEGMDDDTVPADDDELTEAEEEFTALLPNEEEFTSLPPLQSSLEVETEFTALPPDGIDTGALSPDEAELISEVAPLLSTPHASLSPSPSKKKSSPSHSRYHIPIDGILNQYPDGQYWIIDQSTEFAAVILRETLEEFHIQAEVTGIKKGPVITMFEILPAPGVKLSRIVNLQDNIALRLAASSVRIVAPIPGKHAVGIEVPNKKRNIVSFREIIEGELRRDSKAKKQEIPVVLGKDITGEAQTVDLAQTPHLLIAGSTGSGKSVCVNSLILSILYQRSPTECRLILIDPKIVELKLYNDIPHLLTPVITEPKRAFQALQYCLCEMERRYACLDSMGVRDIKSYNRRIRERGIATEHIPYIVIVIDEFADLMVTTGKEMESTVARLAAMSRAVGIHLVLATQRPSIDVITGLIKANIPSRIAFMVASKMDSRIIIDQVGAEKLLGKGDMLYAGVVDPFPSRIQGTFISEEEVERVVDHVKTLGEPEYIDDEIFYDDEDEENDPSLFADGEDPLYDKALEIVTQQGKASASYIQRRLKIGYNRAARIVEEMAARGLVGPAQGSKPRELLHNI